MTRKRRCLIVAGILAGSVAVVLGVLAMLPPQPGITKANFDRIEKGMTREDVEVLFGGKGQPWGGEPAPLLWWNEVERRNAIIHFANDRVEKKTWELSGWVVAEESYTDKLRRWLHLPK